MPILATDLNAKGQLKCAKLKELLADAYQSYTEATDGLQSSWADRSVTTQNLSDLKDLIESYKSEIQRRCQVDSDGFVKRKSKTTYRGGTKE